MSKKITFEDVHFKDKDTGITLKETIRALILGIEGLALGVHILKDALSHFVNKPAELQEFIDKHEMTCCRDQSAEVFKDFMDLMKAWEKREEEDGN